MKTLPWRFTRTRAPLFPSGVPFFFALRIFFFFADDFVPFADRDPFAAPFADARPLRTVKDVRGSESNCEQDSCEM